MRLRERRQVPDGPRNHIAIAMQIAVAFAVGAEHLRDIARHRWLLGQNSHCPGNGRFPRSVAQGSILTGGHGCRRPPESNRGAATHICRAENHLGAFFSEFSNAFAVNSSQRKADILVKYLENNRNT